MAKKIYTSQEDKNHKIVKALLRRGFTDFTVYYTGSCGIQRYGWYFVNHQDNKNLNNTKRIGYDVDSAIKTAGNLTPEESKQ